MSLLTDARKAARMARDAIRSRAADRAARREMDARGPFEEGRFRIAVYFADDGVNAYQVRQWYGPLAELAERHPVVVLARSATGARTIANDGVLPVAYVPSTPRLESTLDAQDIRIVLYVNQHKRNFQMFRYARRWHVFICHGESDKSYMWSNQYKAYDYAFIAGDAAHDRLQKALWGYDVDRRTIQVGRPQVDHYAGDMPYAPDERTAVLYAPTWEGDRSAMRYGSVQTHGEILVRQLLADPRYRVIYRPHPRTGVLDPSYGAASRRISHAIAAANRADPSAQHVHDDRAEVGWQLAAADIAIVDVSAMLYDRLATGKPLMVTWPTDPSAEIDDAGYLGACEWLSSDAASRVSPEIERVVTDGDTTERHAWWVRHYFGDTTPGAPTARFHAAVDRLMAEWDEWARRELPLVA